MTDDKILHISSDRGESVTAQYSCWSRAGADPYGRAKENQDAYVVREFLGVKNICFFGVFDGHGADGAKVSNELVGKLPYFLMNCAAFETGDYKEAFASQMAAFNKHLVSLPYIRCIVGRVQDGRIQVVRLSTDHTPDVPEEASRILSKQGRIKPYVFDGMAVGPNRVWLPHAECPGLSMTRAFGDQLGASVGVSSEPEICQFDLGPEDRYMVLCTDGIFEFLTNEDILDYVDQKANLGWQTSDIAQGLVAEANRCWKEEEDGIVDDCTVIVALLNVIQSKPAKDPKTTQLSKAMKEVARKNANLLSPQSLANTTGALRKLSLRE